MTRNTTTLTLVSCAIGITLSAQHPPAIASISICSTSNISGQGSCSPGTYDTQQNVLGPSGNPTINAVADATSDEHASVFSPGTLGNNSDYLFFVAAGSAAGKGIGALVLTGHSGPGPNGQWSFDFADGYGSYPTGPGYVFTAPFELGHCPNADGSDPTKQDPTFDLHYAAPGSIVKIPQSRPGSLLMIYEGTNSCIGNSGGGKSTFGGVYVSAGVATSFDYGKTWPTYRADFVQLPGNNSVSGPFAPYGAMGQNVCMGSDCLSTPPEIYGRYLVESPSPSLASLMTLGQKLESALGGQEISGFVDDAHPGAAHCVYLLYADRIARAEIHGESALTFQKWDGQAFETPGVGGADSPIFPDGPFENCEDQSQARFGASISYVEDTQQYLLTFLCRTPGNPKDGFQPNSRSGAAWFYSTSYDLSDPTKWTTPQEIDGSWKRFDFAVDSGCTLYNGWYPTFMSIAAQPAHLSLTGYVFSMSGCQTSGSTRQYTSRAFNITTTK
jgi:hypothetical protein